MPTFKVLKLRADAVIPQYKTMGAVGMDLHTCLDNDRVLYPGDCFWFRTGLAFELPHNVEGQIRPRSGLSARNKIILLPNIGTIDPDYRGEITIPLYNIGADKFIVRHGARIAQLVLAPILRMPAVEVSALNPSNRGEGGFGSTGV